MGINKNDVLTFLAAIASIINLLIHWMTLKGKQPWHTA